MTPAYSGRARLGIELSPGACRLVAIDTAQAGTDDEPLTRVRSFGVLPPGGPDLHAALIAHRQRDAAVVVWGTPSEHRQVVVDDGAYDTMRAEAFHALDQVGIATKGMLADIAPAGAVQWAGPGADARQRRVRRNVVVAMAPASAVRKALEPIVDAGIRIRAVMTPAAALNGLARQRLAFTAPGAIEIHVAIEEFATCIALLRDGALIAARDLPWGFEADGPGKPPRAAEDTAQRLLHEADDFLATIEAPKSAVRRACLYGGLPNARSVTTLMTTGLGVDVDLLDTLFGIDDTQLPEPADEFRRRCAELRLAWIAATAWPPSLNLTRPSGREIQRSKRLAIAAGVVTGLLAGWQIDRTAWWQAVSTTATNLVIGDGRAGAPAGGRGPGGTLAASVPRRGNPPPFNAVLGTIFYSAERPIALVDGRIVGVGDRVRDTDVVQITQTTVVLRDASGRTWHLTRDGR